MSVLDLITGSLRLLGVLASGEQPTASEASDALDSLNGLIDTWQTERLMVYSILPQAFPLAGGQQSYTMGPAGNWNVPRPVRIDSLFLQYTATDPSPLNLPIDLINKDQYNAIVVPGTTSPIPTKCYVDDGFPLLTFYFWPVPTVTYNVNIFTWSLLTQFTAVTDDIAFPPGYERMLRFNLALELAPEYGLTPAATVAAGALDAKAAVKRNNCKPLLMQCDPAITSQGGGWNYLTGE